MRIVIIEPRIPQNTGNIARTCVCTGIPLVLCGPMGFTITESRVKRAGLDYWKDLDLTILESTEQLYSRWPRAEYWYFTSKSGRLYTEAAYGPDSFLVFGSETEGLPVHIREANADRCVRLPMCAGQRCLNLANAVCTALYEALRQNGFPELS